MRRAGPVGAAGGSYGHDHSSRGVGGAGRPVFGRQMFQLGSGHRWGARRGRRRRGGGGRAYAETAGGDDLELLRAVVYGKGLWIATGWKLVTSTDGVHWTDHGKIAAGPIPACNIVEGLAYKQGSFFAACDSSVYRSG